MRALLKNNQQKSKAIGEKWFKVTELLFIGINIEFINHGRSKVALLLALFLVFRINIFLYFFDFVSTMLGKRFQNKFKVKQNKVRL